MRKQVKYDYYLRIFRLKGVDITMITITEFAKTIHLSHPLYVIPASTSLVSCKTAVLRWPNSVNIASTSAACSGVQPV